MKGGGFLACCFLVLSAGALAAKRSEPDLRHQIPTTVSAEAARLMKEFLDRPGRPADEPLPVTQADWDRQAATVESTATPMQQKIAREMHISTREDSLGGVRVVRILPEHFVHSGRLLVYVHGGGYVLLSAHSAISTPALLAAAIGDEVISIDYTLAPRGNWRTVTDEVIAVWKAVLSTGADPASIGLFGDSAGGGLAAGALLKMRDQGIPLPGALYLGSPWADITNAGDTTKTLAEVDPILSARTLAAAAAAYAAPADQKNPYVSPVYGDYSRPFPPTLIQAGTREIFLSQAIRQYQAIRSGGHEAILDVYEGMPHVFQAVLWGSPEAKTAVEREAAFFKEKLARRPK
jgi:acetyl esterase/lipase